MENFNVGDVVCLKSDMRQRDLLTIFDVNNDECTCVYIDKNGVPQKIALNKSAIKMYKKPAKPDLTGYF